MRPLRFCTACASSAWGAVPEVGLSVRQESLVLTEAPNVILMDGQSRCHDLSLDLPFKSEGTSFLDDLMGQDVGLLLQVASVC